MLGRRVDEGETQGGLRQVRLSRKNRGELPSSGCWDQGKTFFFFLGWGVNKGLLISILLLGLMTRCTFFRQHKLKLFICQFFREMSS